MEKGVGNVRVDVYAIRNAGSWSIRISLDVRADLIWWAEEVQESPRRMVFLVGSIPLGWALKLEQTELRDKGLDVWHLPHWKQFVNNVLEEELQEAAKFHSTRRYQSTAQYESSTQYVNEDSMWMWEFRDGDYANAPWKNDREMDGEVRIRIKNQAVLGNRMKVAGRERKVEYGVMRGMPSEREAEGLRDHGVMREVVGGRKVGDLRDHGMKREVTSESKSRNLRDHEVMGELPIRSKAERLQAQEVMGELLQEAGVLVEALRGRSLLVVEVDALLAETAPTLAGSWFMAAQLAYLQGQLAFGAGVAPAASPARGALWPQRRHKILRCRRCGSVALGRTACASCGSAACAYCEACLAMGRSRACALLLRGAAHPAVRGTAGGSPTEAMGRWGLSAAQSAAAGAALRFLATPPVGGVAMGTSVPTTPIDHSTPSGNLTPSGTTSASTPSGHLTPSGTASPSTPSGRSTSSGTASPSTPSGRSTSSGTTRASPRAATKSRSFVPARLRSSATAKPDCFLLWAVTGAGKTEMIFPLLDAVLKAGGRVLVATPRRDVVLELAPRLARAFPDEMVVTLYGGSQERWRPGNLTLATTHQLMRFNHAFDLVIIDEIDAFPFHNDPMLAYAAQNACKPEGKFVYLSATPPRQLQKEVASGKLPHAKVPVRFHGHPLPVPSRLDMKSVAHCLRQQRISDKIIHNLGHSIQRGAQCFIFVSRIRHIEPLVKLLRHFVPGIRIEGTSSVDPHRAEKVLAFRETKIRMLITTTILERGVTVPRSDVFILDADSDLFDEASLIQMAGRAGRSKDDPAGRVFLASPEWTKSQKRAVSQIRRMNRIARREGYLNRDHADK
jgi:competence protein ComFA